MTWRSSGVKLAARVAMRSVASGVRSKPEREVVMRDAYAGIVPAVTRGHRKPETRKTVLAVGQHGHFARRASPGLPARPHQIKSIPAVVVVVDRELRVGG